MRIAQSNVNLISSNRYHEENSVAVTSAVMPVGSFIDSLKSQQKKGDSLELTEISVDEEALKNSNYSSLRSGKSEYLNSATSSLEDQISELRISILERLIKLLQKFDGERSSRGFRRTLQNMANMFTGSMTVNVTTVTATHHEEEATTFTGTGTALTEDGRAIDFGVNFSMSRSLTQYAGMDIASAVNYIDPLVINVGGDVTHISDQSFYFDLDCDGKDEKISNLGMGSGFLSLDKNGDGKINDGSELFGTKSGNGFKDLGLYDKDGNGWIDENDEVYEQLRIWIRNEDGTDSLLSLKEADVGAIYLGSAETRYTHMGADLMARAMTRASGVFLKESGGVGTVAQVDLAAI